MDLEHFLQDLILKKEGGFVLYGHQPLCMFSLHDTDSKMDEAAFEKRLASLSEKERALFEKVKRNAKPVPELERNPYQGWLAFQKVTKNLPMKNFLFVATPSQDQSLFSQGKGHYKLLLINIQNTAFVLAENYEIFKQASGGMDFHPLQAVFELQDPDSIFWKNVFSNHLAKGLLFGFGLKNSLFGSWYFSSFNGELSLPSEKYREEIEDYLTSTLPTTSIDANKKSTSGLKIPIFGAVPGDKTPEKYASMRDAIENLYLGKDVVEVTLQHLAGTVQ